MIPMPTNVDVNSTRQIPEADDVRLTKEQHAALVDRVKRAKSLLVLDHCFFGMAVSKRDLIWTYEIKTASMDAFGQMRINPAFAYPLTVRQLMFLLAHEALHYMLCHSTRRGERDPEMWNIAADYVINDTLEHALVGDFIEGGLKFDGARELSAEQLYADPPEGGDGIPDGGIGMDIGACVDEDGKPLDESTIKQLETQAKVELINTAKVAKSRGQLPSGLERMIDEIVNVKTPWHVILEPFMVNKIKDDISWKRQNRRFIHQGLYLPAHDYLPRMGVVCLAIDTSCSVDDDELALYGGHVNRIFDLCRPSEVHVIYCDARVHHVDVFGPDEYPIKLALHGGGGTAFQPVFDYIDDQGIDPDAVVYLTDGWGDQDEFESDLDTVWLTTDRTDFKWGTVIEYDPHA